MALTLLFQRITAFRRWLLVAGMAAICYSQYLMENRFPLGDPNPAAENWNVVHKLEIVNYENVVAAFPYLVGGAVLCALFCVPISWKKPFENWSRRAAAAEQTDRQVQIIKVIIGLALFTLLLIQLSRHQYEPIHPILWLAAIGLFTHAVWKLDGNARNGPSLGIDTADFFWLTVLLTLGFAIGAFALNDIPVYIVPDEGSFWETARAIAQKELHPPVFDSGVYTFPVASSIFQGWVLRVFGVNLWGWRFSSVIAAVLTVIPLYLLTRLWFGRTTGVTACVLMVANPYFLAFARMGYNNSQALFPVTLAILFFAIAARKGSLFYLWLAGLTAGFGFYTYFSAWLGMVVLSLGVFVIWAYREVKLRRALVMLGVLWAAWTVVFAPRLAYTVSGPLTEGLVYKIVESSFFNAFYGRAYYDESALSATTPLIQLGEDQTIFYNPGIYGELLYRSTVRTFLAMFNPYIVSEHFLNSGLSGVISPVFFLIGLVLSLRQVKQLRFALPLLWITGGMLLLSILNTFPPRHTHLVSIIPSLALVSAIGLTAAAESLAELTFAHRSRLKTFAQMTLVTATALAVIYFGFHRYFTRMQVDYPAAFEDIASWLAWRTEEPLDLIYLGETEVPHRVEYLVKSKMVLHTYKTHLLSEFSPQTDLDANNPTIIFVDSPNAETFPLQDLSLPGFGEPVTFKYRDEYITGFALTNTDVDLSPKVGTDAGLDSLTTAPVRYVLFTLVAILILLGVLLILKTKAWSQKEFLLEIGQAPSNAGNDTDAGKVEFNFHLRIRIPPRKRTPH
jgi:4-amino-4-deoxy-L-arabinose transferase-like glycosyltransferase